MTGANNNSSGFALLRLTNFFIRITWRSCALVVALCVRLPTSIILAVIAYVQRARIVRW